MLNEPQRMMATVGKKNCSLALLGSNLSVGMQGAYLSGFRV
jgi:hypothetical protein